MIIHIIHRIWSSGRAGSFWVSSRAQRLHSCAFLSLLNFLRFLIWRLTRRFCFARPTAKMVKMSVMNDALKNMCNAEKAGKRQVWERSFLQSPSPFARSQPLFTLLRGCHIHTFSSGLQKFTDRFLFRIDSKLFSLAMYRPSVSIFEYQTVWKDDLWTLVIKMRVCGQRKRHWRGFG